MGQITPPIGFYVYQLVDPRDGLPFYVGKGQGWRAWQHQRAVQTGKPGGNASKVAKIEEILRTGSEVEVQIVAVYDLELEALDHEYRLVDASPTLTNVMPGGIGRVETPEMALRRYRARKKKLQEKRRQEREAAHQRDLARAAEDMRNSRGADKHRSEIDAWMGGLKNTKALLRHNPRQSSKASKQALAEFRASKPL